jgi:hypothetical protein
VWNTHCSRVPSILAGTPAAAFGVSQVVGCLPFIMKANMHVFARCGEACTLTLRVPARGSFADVRAALLSKRPKLAAYDDLVSITAEEPAWYCTFPCSCTDRR